MILRHISTGGEGPAHPLDRCGIATMICLVLHPGHGIGT
jgi:hypothetical protein